jgi:surface protein
MFDYAHAFNGDISDWNTTNVVDMKFMFYEARGARF